MTDSEKPTTTGAPDSEDGGDLRALIEEADEQHGDDGAAAMADHLRDRVEETEAEPEEPGDRED